jgi:phage tail tape measure protein, TP901 family, core region
VENGQLGLKIVASLNVGASVGEINNQLKALAKHPSLQKLNIKIDVDKSFVQLINSFITATQKLSVALDTQSKVVKETITEYKNLDGSIKRVTEQTLENERVITRTKITHDANKKAISEESRAYDEQRKTLSQLEAEMNGYTKASEKVNHNKTGQINSITNTYKNADTGKIVTVNTDAEGNVNNYSKVSQYLKAEQDALRAEQEINKQREQVAKEEYNTRKALADKNLREEEQRTKDFITALKNRFTQEQAILKNKEEMEKIHYLALQQNQKRNEQYAKSVADTQQKINDARSKYSNNSGVVTSLNELENKLKLISNNGDFKSPLSALNNDIKRTISGLDEGSHHSRTFGQSLKQAFGNIAVYGGIGAALMRVQNFFREGISYVNDLNKSLTELSIVYMQGQDEVERYGEKFHNLAMQMGLTTDEIAKGAVEFARQGLNQEEMFSRMESAVKYATISNLDFSTSAKVLTATVNSMNVDIDRASDVFSYLGDATATGADEVGEAMQRVGGTAGAVGVEFEKVASWIATISSNTRESASTIGNSIKSILARMQSLKESGFDEEDGTKVNDVAKALGTIGVQLVDAQGNFRNFGTVLDEVGGKWSGLDSRTKAYIATATAGSYQSARFLALMDDYGQSVDLYKGALDSAGISTEKFNLYQESTQAHLNKLKTALEGLWTNTFDSKTMRSVIDSATSLISSLGGIAKQFGGINTVVVIATTALLTFNRGLRMSALSAFGIDLKAVALATQVFTGSTIAARVAVFALQATMTLGLSVAIAGVVAGLTHLLNKYQEQKELNQQIAEQNKTIANSWNTQKDKVNELVSKYEDLQKATKNGSIFADQEQEDKYKKTIDDLATLMPNLVQSIDDKGNKHLKNAEAIKAELDVAKQLADIENRKTKDNAQDSFKEKINEINTYKEEIANIQAEMGIGGDMLTDSFTGMVTKTSYTSAQLAEFQTRILNLQQKITSAADVTREDISGLVQALLSINGVKIDDNISSQLQSIVASLSLDGLNEQEIYDKSVTIKNLLADLNNLKSSTNNANSNELIKHIKELGTSIGLTDVQVKELIHSLNSVPNANPSLDEQRKAAADAKDEILSLADAMKILENSANATADEMDNFYKSVAQGRDKITLVNQAQIELKKNGYLSIDTLQKLTKNFEGFTDVLGGGTSAILAFLDAQEKEAEGSITAQKKKTKEMIEATYARIQAIQAELEAMNAIAEANDSINNADDLNKEKISIQHSNALQSAKEFANTLSDQLKILDYIGKDYDSTAKSAQDATDSTDKFTDSTSDTVEVLTELQKKLKENADALDRLHNKQSRMKEGSEEYQKAVDKEISLLKEKKRLLDQGIADPSQLVSTKVTTTTKTTSDSSGNSSNSTSNSSSSSFTGSSNSNVNNMLSAALGLQGKFTYKQVAGDYKGTFEEFVKGATSDCSQFVQEMFKQYLDVDLPRTAAEQAKQGSAVKKSDLQSGDLVYFNTTGKSASHVGIYTGNGKFIQMGNSGLKESSLDSSYWASRYEGARRVVNSNTSSTSSSNASSNGKTKTTQKTGNTTVEVKVDAPTAKDMADAKEQKLKERDDLDVDLNNAYIKKLNGKKQQYENLIVDVQTKIDDSKRLQDTLDPNSVEWRKENNKQVNLKTEIQDLKHEEKNQLQYMMNALGVQSEDYDNFLKKLSTDWKDIQSDKNSQLVTNLTSQIAQSKQAISDYGDSIDQSKVRMAQFAKGTAEYNKELNYQIATTKKQKSSNDNLIKFYEDLIKNGKLAPAYVAQLKQELEELKKEDYTSSIKGLNAELIESKSYPLEQKLSGINDQLDLSEAKMKSYVEGSAEYNQEVKNQIVLQNDRIAVTKQLISYEETQSKNEELTAEARDEHKKKLQQLTLSLYDYAEAVRSLKEQYANRVIEDYKNMLQEQQKLQKDAYEKEKDLENERHENRIKNLDDEMSAFQDLINAQSKSLDRDVASEDYQDQLSKLQKEKSELDSKFSTLLLDDSLEAKSKRADLQKEIDAKAEEITKLQRDREITIRKDGLSDQLEDRQNAVDKEKKLEDEKNAAVIKNIENLEKINDDYYDGLLNDEQYFYNMKQALMSNDAVQIQNQLNIIKGAYDTFFKKLEDDSTISSQKIKDNLKYSETQDFNYAMDYPYGTGNGSAGDTSGNGTNNNNSSNNTGTNNNSNSKSAERDSAWMRYLGNKQVAERLQTEMKSLKSDSTEYKEKEKQRAKLHAANEIYRKQYGFIDGTYDQLKNLTTYHTGGEVGVDGTSTKKWWKNFEVPALLKKGEVVLDKPRDFFSEIASNIMSNLSGTFSALNSSSIFNSTSLQPASNSLTINIDSITGDKSGAKIVTDAISDIWNKKTKSGW